MIVLHRAALLAGAALLALPAFAQDQAAPAAAPAAPAATNTADAGDTGDIVVTARFRTETLKDVPIAITAINGQSLAERQLNNVQTISATVPSVGFRDGASNKDRTIFIRGIGTITTSPGVEPSVSTVLDGIVLARPGQATLDLGEVERIEVLRGPQGTLFGKNASAGVVNIVTRDPTDQFRAFGEAGLTSDREYRVKAGVSGALVPGKLDGLITGLYDKFDGNARNVRTGDRINGFRRYGARAKLIATPTDTLKLTLIGDYLNSRDTTPTSIYQSTAVIAYPTNVVNNSVPLANVLASDGIVPGPSNRKTGTNFDTDVRDKNFGVSLTGELELGAYHLTSITGWRKWLNAQHQDFDSIDQLSTTFAQGEDFGNVNMHQVSQELRLTSPKGGLIDYVVGAYFLNAKNDERYQRNLIQLINNAQVPTTGIANYGTNAYNYSLFGEANVNFTKRFRAILGYRTTWDTLRYYHVRTSTNDPTNSGAASTDKPGIRGYHNTSGSTDTRGDSYRLGLQYDLSSHAQVYATASRGYKGPAYNVYFNMRSLAPGVPLDEIALKPETSQSYEIGLKGDSASRAISYSLALYHTKFNNYQANFTDTVGGAQVTRLINAGTVTSQGVEADLTVRPARGFSVAVSAAYTDATVDSFFCPAGAPVSCNINGKVLPYAPKVKLYVNAAYKFALTDALAMELQSDVSSSSKVQYSLAETPSTIQPAYAIWNASVALFKSGSGWQVRGYVKNITDNNYASYLANGTFAGTVRYVPRDDRRYFGVLLRKDF